MNRRFLTVIGACIVVACAMYLFVHGGTPEIKTEPGAKDASMKPMPTKGKNSFVGDGSEALDGKESAGSALSSGSGGAEEPLPQWNRGMSAEVEHETIQYFESEALKDFPVHTIETFDPLQPNPNGPKRGEVWIRIKAENSREMKEVMAQTADVYREITGSMEPVTIMHWVGNRPYAKFTYKLGE